MSSKVHQGMKPSKKGQKLAEWRIILFGKIHCEICLSQRFWGYHCCWECDRLHLCYPKWIRFLKDEDPRCCPFSLEKRKQCSVVLAKYKLMLSSKKVGS